MTKGITFGQAQRVCELWPWDSVLLSRQAGVVSSLDLKITLKPHDIDSFIDSFMGKVKQ